MSEYYSLYTNGDLVYSYSNIPYVRSSLVVHVWPADQSSRANAWKILLESLALGANIDRVRELAQKWKCDEDDFNLLLVNSKLSALMKEGVPLFFKEVLGKEFKQYG